MSVGATKILPLEAVPPAQVSNEFDPLCSELSSGGLNIVDFESDDRGNGLAPAACAGSEDLQHLIHADMKHGHATVIGDGDLQTEHVSEEGESAREVIGANPNPRQSFDLHLAPPSRFPG
jgi:hypothetical protein